MSQAGHNRLNTHSERTLGEYSILAELARGGMGKVYVARRSGQAGFERYFAIKVMHQQLNDDQNMVMMLLDEAHIASRLHHPNVVPVLDIGTFGDGYYLVMDYVEGCSLQQLLRASPSQRPVKAVVSIMLDALRGLHAVHTLRGLNDEALHVVHRDVSPHNLLLGLDGGCRVTDFGIAKARQRFTDTDIGIHKGKLAFMAPEQMRGHANLDCRVDVWAAGVTLYTALTGVHPFREENDAATVHAILGAEIALPSEVGLKPSPVFDTVIMRALLRDPEARYASAEEFAEALRAAALSENLLGSSSDVAAWVKATCGAELGERRRKLASIPRNEETITTTSATSGGTSSLPKLWFASEGGNTSSSGPHITIGNNSWHAASTSFAARTFSTSRAKISLALVGLVAAVGLGVMLGRGATDSAPQASAPPQATTAAAGAEPAPVKPAAEQPLSPAPKPAAVVAHADPVDAQVRTVAEVEPRARKPRQVFAPKAHKSVGSGAESGSPSDNAPSQRNEPAAAEVHAPAPAAPARNTGNLDRNPYLLGE